MIPLISSDRAFEQAANAFAAVPTPAYVRYTEKYFLESKTLKIARRGTNQVIRKVANDASVVTYEPSMQVLLRSRHLISPTFDVLSDFGLRGTFSSGNVAMWVENVRPLQYNLTPRPGVDSVSIALQKYRTAFVDDSSTDSYHIHLDSANGATDISPRLFFKELYIDAHSGFPTRAELVGPDEREFDVRYAVVAGRPMVQSYLFAQTFSTGFGLLRARVTLHIDYSDVVEDPTLDDSLFVRPASSPLPPPR